MFLYKPYPTLSVLLLLISLLLSVDLLAGPLHGAAEIGAIDRIEQLIQQGADVNEIDNRGIWPLLAATTYGNTRSVVVLLKHGANPSQADKYNYTALHEAATLCYPDVAEKLIGARANINVRDINSYTPLGYAQLSGCQEVINLLESHGGHM